MDINWIVVIIIFAFAILRVNKYWTLSILVIYFFCRGDYGNDYYAYLDYYNDISKLKFEDLNNYSKNHSIEKGWVIINWIISLFNVDFNVFITFWNIIYLFLINKLISYVVVNNQEYNIVILLMTLDPDFILTHFSILRQALPILIFYIAFINIKNMDLSKIIIVGIITIAIHNSAIIPFALLVIVYVLNSYKVTVNKLMLFSIPILGLIFYNLNFILSLVFSNFERYQNYGDVFNQKKINYGLSFFWLYSISFYYYKIKGYSVFYNQLFFIFFVYLIIFPLSLYLGAITRLTFYFQFSVILVILEIYRFLKNKSNLLAILFLVFGSILPFFYKSYVWFHQDTWIDNYLYYIK